MISYIYNNVCAVEKWLNVGVFQQWIKICGSTMRWNIYEIQWNFQIIFGINFNGHSIAKLSANKWVSVCSLYGVQAGSVFSKEYIHKETMLIKELQSLRLSFVWCCCQRVLELVAAFKAYSNSNIEISQELFIQCSEISCICFWFFIAANVSPF